MDLAGRTGLVTRTSRGRWLCGASRGLLSYDRSGQMCTLPDEHAAVGTTRTARPIWPGCSLCSRLGTRPEEGRISALRVGGGVGWDEHSDSPYRGTVRLPATHAKKR